jgi:hypothetical protein
MLLTLRLLRSLGDALLQTTAIGLFLGEVAFAPTTTIVASSGRVGPLLGYTTFLVGRRLFGGLRHGHLKHVRLAVFVVILLEVFAGVLLLALAGLAVPIGVST